MGARLEARSSTPVTLRSWSVHSSLVPHPLSATTGSALCSTRVLTLRFLGTFTAHLSGVDTLTGAPIHVGGPSNA